MRISGHIYIPRHGVALHTLPRMIDAFAFGLWVMARGQEDFSGSERAS